MATLARPGRGDLRSGGRTLLGNAASTVVGTPRQTAPLVLSTPQRASSSRAASSAHTSSSSTTSGAAVVNRMGLAGERHRQSLKGSTAASNSLVVPGKTTANANLSLVRALKGTGLEHSIESSTTMGVSSDAKDDEDSDNHSNYESQDNRSVCSNSSKLSNVSALSNMSTTGPKTPRAPGGGSSSNGNRSIHMSFSSDCSGHAGECSISIEQQSSLDSSKMSLCLDFNQLCAEGQGDGLMQCVQMNGYSKPNKLQQHVIPAVLHFMGKQLGGQTGSVGKGKSSIVIQGPEKSGKTSAVLLSLIAAVDLSLAQPQAILLSSSAKRDFDKLLSVFTLMQSIRYSSFPEEDVDVHVDETSAEVKAARSAHLLVGHPKSILKLLSSVPAICLDSVKAMVIDDVEELLYQAQPDGSFDTSASQVIEAAARAGIGGIERRPSQERVIGEGRKSEPSLANPLLDDIVQICNVLECRQFSHNMSDTYRIRKGEVQSTKLRYVILSQPVVDNAARKVLRLLKTSLMKKKNLLGIEGMPPPTKIIKAMKHYYAEAPRSEWVRIFAGLVQSLMFPRAIIFCDDENFAAYAKELQDMGVAVSINQTVDASDACEARRKAVQDFSSNRTQFLLTRSEPAICQIALPKVSSVFHFGLPPNLASVYGVRLLPLDAAHIKDAPSILFVDAPRGGDGKRPALVKGVGKLFDIDFMDMPFEFLPVEQTSPGGRRPR